MDDLVDGDVGSSDEGGADGVVVLDGEDDVGSQVGAVDVKGLVPFWVFGFVLDLSCSTNSGSLEIDRCV